MDQMKEPTSVIDENGDVVIVLRNPNAPFTVWAEGPESAKEKKMAESQEFRILVSSKHLILLSPVFKAAFTRDWKEGRTLLNEGNTNTARQQAIENISILLDNLMFDLLLGLKGCSSERRSVLIGSHIYQRNNCNLLSPDGKPPFVGLSAAILTAEAGALQAPTVYPNLYPGEMPYAVGK
ncbi:hypothetical protein BBP40_009349 [Aspergillus hancockii]|nr:hypothetical protein BBP40_009349 [Aspergillus hancockii]